MDIIEPLSPQHRSVAVALREPGPLPAEHRDAEAADRTRDRVLGRRKG